MERKIKEQRTAKPGNYMYYYDDVYKALTGQGENKVPGTDGVKSIRIIEAAKESFHKGHVIKLS
jgi:scyllo-inositol 2-dehydrogenase (NADP+)